MSTEQNKQTITAFYDLMLNQGKLLEPVDIRGCERRHQNKMTFLKCRFLILTTLIFPSLVLGGCHKRQPQQSSLPAQTQPSKPTVSLAVPPPNATSATETAPDIRNPLRVPNSSVIPALTGLTFNPSTVAAGEQFRAEITLSAPAPSGGVTVMLTVHDGTGNSFTIPVKIPKGDSAFISDFGSIKAAASLTIDCTYAGVTKEAKLTVLTLTDLRIIPGTVAKGDEFSVVAYISSAAPRGGVEVALEANGVPQTPIRIDAGDNSGSYIFKAGSISSTFECTYGGRTLRVLQNTTAEAATNNTPTEPLPNCSTYHDGDGAGIPCLDPTTGETSDFYTWKANHQ